jgi:hypothetical protein
VEQNGMSKTFEVISKEKKKIEKRKKESRLIRSQCAGG